MISLLLLRKEWNVTGIIEEVGIIKKIIDKTTGVQIDISATKIMDDMNVGDSIAINGVCLTVTKHLKNSFSLDLVADTLQKSNLGDLQIGDNVNLERALRANGRFGGHIVQGHVETLGVILEKQDQDDGTLLSIGLDPEWMRFCIAKGSIAIDGISLTIAKIDANIIQIALIPHTLQNTTLGKKNKSDTLNIETDIIGKYVTNLLSFEDEDSDLDVGMLKAIRHLQYGES